MRSLRTFLAASLVLLVSRGALAQQPTDPAPAPAPTPGPTSPPPTSDPMAEPPPASTPSDPMMDSSNNTATPVPPKKPQEHYEMSEGRMLVSLYNSGFQWGISPGIAFANDKTGFTLGLNVGYGFDRGPVILVPGARLSGWFLDPMVFMGMPTLKVVIPFDRFAPFAEVGAGPGHITKSDTSPSSTGLAVMGGVGFMIHFTQNFAAGAHGSYTVISGTDFSALAVGPIIAIGF